MKPSIFILFVSLVLLQSCQPLFTDDSLVTNPPILDSAYIDRILVIEVNGTAVDTFGTITYSYDNQKRVTEINLKAKDPLNLEGINYTYFYNGLDTLPSRSVVLDKDYNGTTLETDTLTTFHYFDATGRNIRDSLIIAFGSGKNIHVSRYSYSGNKIFGIRTKAVFPSGVAEPESKDTATTGTLGNVVDSKRYKYNFSTSTYVLASTSTFIYDNRQSPYARLSNFKTFRVFPSGETLIIDLPQFSNRVTQRETSQLDFTSGGIQYDNDFDNTYNAKGQLKEIKLYEGGTIGSGIYDKLVYYYKSL